MIHVSAFGGVSLLLSFSFARGSACADVELPLGVLDFKDMCAANTMYATNYDPEYGYMQYMGQPAMYYRQPSDGKTSGGKYQQKDKSRDIDRGGTTYRSQAHNWHSDRPGMESRGPREMQATAARARGRQGGFW